MVLNNIKVGRRKCYACWGDGIFFGVFTIRGLDDGIALWSFCYIFKKF